MSEYTKGPITLRLGDYRETLADVEPDAVITDPPYSKRTHGKQQHGRHRTPNGAEWISVRDLSYAAWGDDDIAAFWQRWAEARGWVAVFADDVLSQAHRAAAKAARRTVFAPLSCVQIGMNVRLAGDGPSNWTTYLNVSRPKSLSRWGTLPGAYVGSPCDPGRGTQNRGERAVAGAKPVWLMRSIVRDYSRPGDLIADPCAGGATTLIAAALEGRRATGSELDPDTYEKACKRIERTALTPPLPALERAPMDGTQEGLDL